MNFLPLFFFLTIATAGLLDDCILVENNYKCDNVVPKRFGEILHNLIANDYHQCWKGCVEHSRDANVSIFQRTAFKVLCVCIRHPMSSKNITFTPSEGAVTVIYSGTSFS